MTKVQWCIQQACAIVHDEQLCLKQQKKKIHCGATVEKSHCGARPGKLQHSALDQIVGVLHLLVSLSVKTQMATRSASLLCSALHTAHAVDQITTLQGAVGGVFTICPISTNLPELVMGIPRRQPINDRDEQDEFSMNTTFSNSAQQVNANRC